MNSAARRLGAAIAAELRSLYEEHRGLRPETVVGWASRHPKSALHGRFQWDDTIAAHQYRLWQARELITTVTVEYADGKVRQVYVSPVSARANIGYQSLVHVLADDEMRAEFLAQALAEYQRIGDKYRDLQELAGVRQAVTSASRRLKPRVNGSGSPEARIS